MTKEKALGYNARHMVQDHSYVPDMWRRFTNPDLLIYLDAELSTIARRRRISWGERYLADERLRHARQHCDLYLSTDDLTEEEVPERVERERLSEVIWWLALQHGVVLSVLPVDEKVFETRQKPLFLNVRREGIVI